MRFTSIFVVGFLLLASTAFAQPTVKTQSGGVTGKCSGTTNGGDITLTFDNVATGDITVLYGGRANSSDAGAFGPITSGYNQIAIVDSTGPKLGVWYKIQGGTPDANVQGEGAGGAAHGVAYCMYVLDGTTVHADLFDQTVATTGQVSAVPDCPQIVTQTANALVTCHSGNSVVDASPGTVTNYTVFAGSGANGNDNDDITVGGAFRTIVTPTTENPAAWSSWSTGTGGSFTIAWKAVGGATPCYRTLLGVGC